MCETLMHEDNLKLLDRNLSSQRSKEHLIEPCIRLLTEIVQFDGGSFAKIVFRRRFTTFQRLEIFLATRKSSEKHSDRDRRRVSIREVSVRYLLTNLRLQDQKGKEFLLNQPRLSRALLQYLSDDPPWLSRDVFEVLEKDVLRDGKVVRSVQRRFFNSASLLDLARLYEKDDVRSLESGHTSLRDKAHSLLVLICTSPTYGLLQIDRDTSQADILDRSDVSVSTANDDVITRPRNRTALSSIRTRFIEFFQRLRPHADLLQSELVIQAFQHHPALMAEYFQHKGSFTLDPKLTMTWLGYSRFILACIQVPISEAFITNSQIGQDFHVSILDCVLPEPCTCKILTKCLNQTNDIVTFMAINLLNAAFLKFEQVLVILDRQQRDQRVTRLINELKVGFSEKCPDIKDVVRQYYASSSEERPAYKQSIARLLINYFRQLPENALEAKFDMSNDLTSALSSTKFRDMHKGSKRLRTLELRDLVQISTLSPNVQWFQNSGKKFLSRCTLKSL